MRELVRDLIDRWSEETRVDYVIVAVLLAGHLAVASQFEAFDLLRHTDVAQRLALYAAGAGVVAVVGSVTSIAIALYQSLGGQRGEAVREHYGDQVRANWRSLLVTTGIAPAACLFAMAADTSDGSLLASVVFESALLLAATRFARLVWLFDSFLAIDDKSKTDTGRATAPAFDRHWGNRRLAIRPTSRQG